jgi:hypothetical protein
VVRADLRTLGATWTGSVVAVEVNGPRDHARMRAFRLAHRELAIPPLDRRNLRKVFDATAVRQVVSNDVDRILRAADGQPGLVARMAARLDDTRYWRDGRVLVEPLRADVMAA